ncbi:MAG: hypothetical protein ACREKE_06850 [bacterium]
MESLERLASSIAQTELLVAALKRENRDLAARLAVAAEDRHAESEDLRAELAGLGERLRLSEEAPRRDPGLEARAFDAEHLANTAQRALTEAQEAHRLERSRLETLIRQLEAQVMASHGLEQLPTASAESLHEALGREQAARAALADAQARGLILESQVRDLQGRLDSLFDSEQRAAGKSKALQTSLEALRLREESLEQGLAERERETSKLRAAAEDAATIQVERAELRRQKRDAQAFARERQGLRRRLEELVATLENVRL